MAPTRRRAAVVRPAAALALSIAFLAACGAGPKSNGEGHQPGSQVAEDALEALRDTPSVHLVETVDSKDGKGGKATLDVTATAHDLSGTIALSGATYHLRSVDGKVYFQGSVAANSKLMTAEQAKLVGNRWLLVTGDWSDITNLAISKLGWSFGTGASWGDDTSHTKLDGKDVVVVTAKADGSKMYVAETGKPYPLRYEYADATHGVLTFSDYGRKVVIKAPADAIDVSKL